MNLEDKLFHAVIPYPEWSYGSYSRYSKEDVLEKIKMILTQGWILSRQRLMKQGYYSVSCKNYNGSNRISLSRYPTRKQEDENYLILNRGKENAWGMGAENYPAFVFLQSSLEPQLDHVSPRISLEEQALDAIPLTMTQAISVGNHPSLRPFFDKEADIKEAVAEYQQNPYYYQTLKELLLLIQQTSYSFPIIEVEHGSYYQEAPSYESLIAKQK